MSFYPKIKFKVDLKADTNNCISFLKHNRSKQYKQFAEWFLPLDLRYILDKKISAKKREKIIKKYTEKNFNDKNKQEAIINGTNQAVKEWEKIEAAYFRLISRIFKNHPWPKGNYRGFASIFNMYPRYINQKIFFFPYTHKIPKYANKVIAHEMLHFIFFDYIHERYGLRERSKIKNRPDNFVWQVSETFNNVMENWKPYNMVMKDKGEPYPGTEKIFKLMTKQWQEKQDVDWLLDKWLKK